MTPSLLPRLLIASGMLRALARLLEMTAAMPDRETADACVHEGVENTQKALVRLMSALDHDSIPDAAFRRAGDQERAVWMDTPDAATLLRWADGWEMMAERVREGGAP